VLPSTQAAVRASQMHRNERLVKMSVSAARRLPRDARLCLPFLLISSLVGQVVLKRAQSCLSARSLSEYPDFSDHVGTGYSFMFQMPFDPHRIIKTTRRLKELN
jgi:hypothetical protein